MNHCLRISIAAALTIASIGCGTEAPANQRRFDEASVSRRDITITASASGLIEPIRVVEVKSKASGEIVELPVETGSYVERGQVLARIYPRDAQNQYAQARAEVEAVRAQLATAETELARATRLRKAELLAETDFETKRLQVINARAQLVKATTSLEIASERLKETTVTAPISGRILQKSVELGNVASSAISQVSGGTTLMKMADLREVQVRTLVDETDIGRIQPGQRVTVRVEAFPNETFSGSISKIEPQSVVDQNVTMFPVLVAIANENEILKPGMNADVEIFIARYSAVLSVPNEAVKTTRDATTAAAALGLSADDVRAAIGPEARGAGGRGGGGGGRAARGGAGQRRRNAENVGVVFRTGGEAPTPLRITLGISNWDFTEVKSGLKEGDKVIVLPSASLLRQQQEFRDRIRGSSGMPGMGGGASRPRT